jgi:hypothetical protein
MALSGSTAPGITLVTWFDNMPAGCINGPGIKTDGLTRDMADLAAKGITIGLAGTPPGPVRRRS